MLFFFNPRSSIVVWGTNTAATKHHTHAAKKGLLSVCGQSVAILGLGQPRRKLVYIYIHVLPNIKLAGGVTTILVSLPSLKARYISGMTG